MASMHFAKQLAKTGTNIQPELNELEQHGIDVRDWAKLQKKGRLKYQILLRMNHNLKYNFSNGVLHQIG